MRYRKFRNITAALVLIAACGSPRAASVNAQTAQYQTGTLDQLLAPIALYPDQLLAQILMSADPVKIAELDKWMKSNEQLKGTALQDGAVKAGFDASFVALVVFPQVVAKMAEQIAWTTVLGQTFTKDRSAVFDTIQKLRAQARNVGTLKDSPQQNVEIKQTSAGQDVIVIEPANPQVIYVPQYNPPVVYTQPPATTTVVVQEDNDADEAIAAGLIGFTAGIAIGAASNNYYYGPCCMYGGAYMYNDAWDDYYDHREDAREDWADHREDLAEERTDRRENTSEQRTDRQENRQENRPEGSAQRAQQAQQQRQASGQSASTQRTNRTGSAEARGYGSGSGSATQRSGASSDAFSGYSSGSSQRSASSRGQTSRSSSARSGGGRSRSGGGRRR
jgi:uncharacterized membrane protein YgcG